MATLGQLAEQAEKEQASFSAMPAGTYKFVVEEALFKTPKNGGEDYLNVMFSCVGEKYNGNKVFTTFNINHAKDQPKKISRGQFAQLAIGCNAPADTELDALWKTPVEVIKLVTDGVLFVKINCKPDTYNGETRMVNNPNAYYALTNETGRENSEKTMAAFTASDEYAPQVASGLGVASSAAELAANDVSF